MKVIRKRCDVCQFEDLNFGDVFKLSETGSLFIKINNLYNKPLNCLDIETGKLYEINSTETVTLVDGYFVEGMVEHDT